MSSTQSTAILQRNLEYSDPNVNATYRSACISVRYTGNVNCNTGAADPSQDLTLPPPALAKLAQGVINYPEHIQPIWTKPRTVNGVDATCSSCHNDRVRLDLTEFVAGTSNRNTDLATGRLVSYQELLLGDPVLENGVPVTEVRDGETVVVLGPALVDNEASQGDAVGLARKSRLTEIIFGERLMAGAAARAAHLAPGDLNSTGGIVSGPDHSQMLNAAEKRLVTEWIDLGGQYYNEPFNPSGGVRMLADASSSLTTFTNTVHTPLLARCGTCHNAVGSNGQPPTFNAGINNNNRYVLTGNTEGDFNASLAVASCDAQRNRLLTLPSASRHPSGATTSVLAGASDPLYQAIGAWVSEACVASGP
jgi:cytochrome c553